MKIAIIGAGNMGGATARGLAQSQHVSAKDIFVSNPSKGKLDDIKAEFPEINITQDNKECVKDADMIILAVKPWKVEDVAREITTHQHRKNRKHVRPAPYLHHHSQHSYCSPSEHDFHCLQKYITRDGRQHISHLQRNGRSDDY